MVAMEVDRAGTSKVEEGATSKEEGVTSKEEAGTAEDTKPGRSHLLVWVLRCCCPLKPVSFLFLLCPVFHRSFCLLALSALSLRCDSFPFPAFETFSVRNVCEMHQVVRSVKEVSSLKEIEKPQNPTRAKDKMRKQPLKRCKAQTWNFPSSNTLPPTPARPKADRIAST